MQINVVKVNGIIWSGDAPIVVAPGSEGELTILPNHVPLVTTLKEGRLVVKDEKKEIFVHTVDGGVLEVTKEGVTVLL
jgi:F-type H+-transporting ATPase subunit epsilon